MYRNLIKTTLSILCLSSIAFAVDLKAPEDDLKMPEAEVDFARRVLSVLENKPIDAIKSEELATAPAFIKRVAPYTDHPWGTHSDVFSKGLRAKLSDSGRDMDKMESELRKIKENPGAIAVNYVPPLDEEVLKSAPKIIVAIQPMSGLNTMLAVEYLQKLIKINPAISVFLIDAKTRTKFKSHDQFVKILDMLKIEAKTILRELPTDSRVLLKWAVDSLLGLEAKCYSTVPSISHIMPKAMEAFKSATDNIQFLYFAANGKQAETHGRTYFKGLKNVQFVVRQPSRELQKLVYGEDMIDRTTATLKTIERAALSMVQAAEKARAAEAEAEAKKITPTE